MGSRVNIFLLFAQLSEWIGLNRGHYERAFASFPCRGTNEQESLR